MKTQNTNIKAYLCHLNNNGLITFNDLALSNDILKVLKELSFEKPTDIQAKAIPILLNSFNDFIGLAQTGTGKTAAFGLPLLELIDSQSRKTQALVMAPTRELCKQITDQLLGFSKYIKGVNVLAVYGGQNISIQLKALKKNPQIVIATPGRLIDLIKRKAVKLDQLAYMVLDEADEMLNMGFKEAIDEILSYTPDLTTKWLFSATMPKEIQRIVNTYMEDPETVKINQENVVNTDITHQYVMVHRGDKFDALTRFLETNPDMNGLIFCRTKRDTQNVAEALLKYNYKADALHGDLSQHQRDRVMKRFKNKNLQVLVATDVAARGIDVNDLTHVFHYSLPEDIAYYTHRSGRTARAGKKGISMAFVEGNEKYRINRLQNKLKITFEVSQIPNAQQVLFTRLQKWSEKIVNCQPNGLDKKLTTIVNENFDALSKEELIEKLIALELAGLSLNNTKNLNWKEKPGQKNRSSRFNRSKSNRRFSSKRGRKNQNTAKFRGYKAGKKKAKR